MDVRWILGVSVLLQIAATLLALRLIRITGKRGAWSLIALAIALMTVRRAFSLWTLVTSEASPPLATQVELIALIISILMLIGLALIAPMFRAFQASELALRDAHDKLEERVRERTDELTHANDSLAEQVAERVEVEKALRSSEERFRTVSETIPAAVFIVRGTKLIEVNPAACALTGYSREELFEMSFWQVFHPDFQASLRERASTPDDGDDIPTNYEAKIRRKNGEDRWVTVAAGLIDYDGERAVISTAYDISQLKSVEDVLREVDAHQRLIFQTVPMAIYTAEPHDNQYIVWISDQVEQITGFPADRFLQRDGFWAERVHPEDVDRVLRIFVHLSESDATAFEYRWKCASGEYRWFLEHPTFVRDATGAPSEIIGTWLDINERKIAEEALARSEKQIQAIIDNTTAVIYVKDLEFRYVLVNKQYETLFKVSRLEAAGKDDFDIFPREIAEAFRENDEAVLRGDQQVQFQEVAPHDDGLHTYLSLKFPLYDVEGHQTGLCGISTDITDRATAEAALQAAKDDAEAANQAKSRFLANISHEIRTPITAMLGAAEQMKSEGLAQDTRLRRSDMILRNGRHLLALVNDLLDVSRLEAGKLEILTADCSLLEILTDVAAITRVSELPADLEFKVILETDVPETIHTDRTRATQAISNLVSNACKFTTRGHVHLRVAVRDSGDEPRLTVTVEDTGPGITEKDRERIFDVFTQGDLPTQPFLTGAGVGLSLSRWIARQLGGSLVLRESSEKGSVFELNIATGDPRGVTWIGRNEAMQRLDEGLPLIARELPRLRGRVLLAEDVADTRTLIEEALASAGATVVTAVDGAEAVDLCFAGDAFDLVLLDIRMPKMDGFTAGRAIRDGGYRLAMIALTASTTAAERGRILGAGFDDVWMKPISLDRLIRRVSAFVDTEMTNVKAKQTETDKHRRTALMSNLSRQFRQILPDRINAIKQAAMRGDREAFRNLLHQLVGSAGMHGLTRISEAAVRLMKRLDESGDLPDQTEMARLFDLPATDEPKNTGEA